MKTTQRCQISAVTQGSCRNAAHVVRVTNKGVSIALCAKHDLRCGHIIGAIKTAEKPCSCTGATDCVCSCAICALHFVGPIEHSRLILLDAFNAAMERGKQAQR